MMKRYSFFFRVEELTHGNQKKNDRVMWALQGRFEHGLITLNKGEWNSRFLDELFQFPDALTHDDLVDALSYVDQLAKVPYTGSLTEFEDFDVLDSVSGY
jgi:phage terminase large subunit-like protein